MLAFVISNIPTTTKRRQDIKFSRKSLFHTLVSSSRAYDARQFHSCAAGVYFVLSRRLPDQENLPPTILTHYGHRNIVLAVLNALELTIPAPVLAIVEPN